MTAPVSVARATVLLPPSADEECARVNAKSAAELLDGLEIDPVRVRTFEATDGRDREPGLLMQGQLRQASGFAQLTNLQNHRGHTVEPITSEKATPPRRLFIGGRWNPAPTGAMPPKRPGSEAPIAQAERLARFARSILGAETTEIARELRTWRDREANGLTDALLEEIARFVAREVRAA